MSKLWNSPHNRVCLLQVCHTSLLTIEYHGTTQILQTCVHWQSCVKVKTNIYKCYQFKESLHGITYGRNCFTIMNNINTPGVNCENKNNIFSSWSTLLPILLNSYLSIYHQLWHNQTGIHNGNLTALIPD